MTGHSADGANKIPLTRLIKLCDPSLRVKAGASWESDGSGVLGAGTAAADKGAEAASASPDGGGAAAAVPQSEQNLAPSGIVWPHFVQIMLELPLQLRSNEVFRKMAVNTINPLFAIQSSSRRVLRTAPALWYRRCGLLLSDTQAAAKTGHRSLKGFRLSVGQRPAQVVRLRAGRLTTRQQFAGGKTWGCSR